MLRLVASAAALALAAAGCANLSGDYNDPTQLHRPQNDGANGSVGDVHVRNAFLLGPPGAEQQGRPPAGQGAGQAPLYAVLVNDRPQPIRLERVTVEGGGTVRLAGTVEVPAGGVAGGDRPIGTVSGLSTRAWVPMTFTFAAGPELRLTVPVLARAGMYATYSPAPQEAPTGSPPPATATPSPSLTGSP